MRILYCGVKGGEKYPAKVRHFCLALHYFSPRGYEYVRKTFNYHLPHSRTIRCWYANSDIQGDPGIQEKHMERITNIAQKYADENNGRELMCSLVFDEMSIRQQVLFSLSNLNYMGFNNNPESQENTVVKQAIVFILNGIDVNFECPVAYFFIDSLKKVPRSNMVMDIIKSVTRCGIKITNLTFDGHPSNVPMCELFGAKIKDVADDVRSFILNPINNQKIYIYMDACHMEKLVRGALCRREVFYDGNNNKIEWRYIVALYQHSRATDLRTHKLTKKHIEWHRNPMNVGLAVETFSESVANSLKYLMDQNIPEFQGAEFTIEFIRKMDICFNIFNSKRATHTNIFKSALSSNNKRVVFDFLTNFIEYLKNLKVMEEFVVKTKSKQVKKTKKTKKMVPVLKSRFKCGIRGFIINAHSLMAMYIEYVEENQTLVRILTYNILQDIIEMLFGRIRGCGGYNNNPNVQQFIGAYRKVQSNMKIDLSNRTNCRVFDMDLPDNLFFSDIYFVSSKRDKIQMNETLYHEQRDPILQELAEVSGWDTSIPTDAIEITDVLANYSLDVTSDFMVEYNAAKIEQKIMARSNFHCSECSFVFDENEKLASNNAHFLSWTPCVSTVEICKNTEKFFRLYDINEANPKFDLKVIYCLIFRSMNFQTLYPNSNFECDINHKYQFIKCIVGQYFSIRANQMCRQITLDGYGTFLRQKLNHLVLYKGQ